MRHGRVEKIMYGVTDFPRMRKENAYFVDRTALIPELEKTPYALFLRPRRFGKSLLCAILQCYYDIDYADRFEELFGGLDIGKNPTIGHAVLIGLKYLKAKDDAAIPLDKYAANRTEAAAYILRGGLV